MVSTPPLRVRTPLGRLVVTMLPPLELECWKPPWTGVATQGRWEQRAVEVSELQGLLTSIFRRSIGGEKPLRQSLAEPTATDIGLENGAVPGGWQGVLNRQQSTPSSNAASRQSLADPTATDIRHSPALSPAWTRRWASPAQPPHYSISFRVPGAGREPSRSTRWSKSISRSVSNVILRQLGGPRSDAN